MQFLFTLWKRTTTKTNRPARVSQAFSGSRCLVAKLVQQCVQSATSAVANVIARSEIDNHADTCCFGSNFTPLCFTGQACDISPFAGEHNSMTNVKVCGVATAWDDPLTGHASILEFHQGLWFGLKLPNSLINPNQCRLFGVSLCDNPVDPHRKLEMHDTETGTTIPLSMHGSICNFSSHVPTKLELDALPRIPMASDES
jgi:hypothetical protein